MKHIFTVIIQQNCHEKSSFPRHPPQIGGTGHFGDEIVTE